MVKITIFGTAKQYVLNEQEVLETLTHLLSKPDEGRIEQHQRNLAAYESWRKKDLCALFTMLRSMHNALIGEFKQYTIARHLESSKAKI